MGSRFSQRERGCSCQSTQETRCSVQLYQTETVSCLISLSFAPARESVSTPGFRALTKRKGLSDDIQLHAISLFFHDYIVHSCQGICEGWLDYLPDLYLEHTESSILRHAVLAAAYANIAQRTTRKDLELKAASFYHTSLERVKNNLSDTQLATSDVNMTAVVLLGIYEVCTLLLQHQMEELTI